MEYIHNIIQQLGQGKWSDYLDILLVMVLVYYVLQLVRSAAAARIGKVVLLILVAAWLTEELELHTLNFLISQVATVGLIALVVLFQPELRRMLEKLGNVKLRNLLNPKDSDGYDVDAVISQTVLACEVMSRERVGALIAFARDNTLEEFFKTGTRIDGQVSEQLIRNIFFPKASLHDGAMIIRAGRVAAAGCVLPLSESSHLSADLGTRHRAGVGLSENTDAVVVIVSEETGTISVAVGGMLKRHLAPQTLERLLHNELVGKDEDNTLPKQRLLQKLSRKVKEGNTHEEK